MKIKLLLTTTPFVATQRHTNELVTISATENCYFFNNWNKDCDNVHHSLKRISWNLQNYLNHTVLLPFFVLLQNKH